MHNCSLIRTIVGAIILFLADAFFFTISWYYVSCVNILCSSINKHCPGFSSVLFRETTMLAPTAVPSAEVSVDGCYHHPGLWSSGHPLKGLLAVWLILFLVHLLLPLNTLFTCLFTAIIPENTACAHSTLVDLNMQIYNVCAAGSPL